MTIKSSRGYIMVKVGNSLVPDQSTTFDALDGIKEKQRVWVKIKTFPNRSYKQLKLIHAICNLVFKSQNQGQVFKELDALKTAIKIYVGFYTETEKLIDLNLYKKEISEQLKINIPDDFKFKRFIGKDFKVGSFSYLATTQEEMNDIFNEIVAFVLTKIAPNRPLEFEEKLLEMLESENIRSLQYE